MNSLYSLEVFHPRGKSIFTCETAVRAWAAWRALAKAFPKASIYCQPYDPSCAPPVSRLSEEELIKLALAEPKDEHALAGTLHV